MFTHHMISLSKQQAIDLIPKIVDGEVTPQEHRRFFDYLRMDDDVRREFESHQKLKIAVCCRCKKEKAPEHLKRRIHMLLEAEDRNDSEH